jgi:ABC-2 type transport system ATP-binding protein
MALDEVSFEVRPGELVGLLGPNGSGKSTVMAICAGLVRQSQGRLLHQGRELGRPDARYRATLGVVFQEPSLDQRLGARENLELAGMMQGLRGEPLAAAVTQQLGFAGLADRARERVSTLSGGLRRRLDIARALIHGPSLLLMDEPTSGLDEAAFRRTWQLIQSLRERLGVSVLTATHRSAEAALCDRLVVLDQGRVVVTDTPAGLIARLRSDVVSFLGPDPAAISELLSREHELVPRVEAGEVLVDCERGHELIARMVETFPAGTLTSVSLRQPSLADVFLRLTGHGLDGERDTAREEAA